MDNSVKYIAQIEKKQEIETVIQTRQRMIHFLKTKTKIFHRTLKTSLKIT